MITKWTQHLKDPKEVEEFKRAVRSAKPVLECLKLMVEDQVKQLDSSELDAKSFDNPNWAYKQAYKNGYRSILNFTKNVLTDLDQDKDTRNDPRPTG